MHTSLKRKAHKHGAIAKRRQLEEQEELEVEVVEVSTIELG